MADGSGNQTLSIFTCIALAFYASGLVCAAWIRPELRKFFLFRPRWQHGIPASPMGMTSQAAVATSLSLMLGSRLAGVDVRYALWVFLASGAFSVIAWANDAAAEKDR